MQSLIRAFAILLAATAMIRADLIECDNGDRYHGTVLSVDARTVRLRNDITGELSIPRAKVLLIRFGAAAKPVTQRPSATQTAPDEQQAGPNAAPSPVPGSGPLQIDPKMVEQVQTEFLNTANPEARQMFQEMVRGLMSGKLQLGDIQKKARSTLEELRSLQKELGDEDAAAVLDSYAGILESFVKQSPAAAEPATEPEPDRDTAPETEEP